MAHTWILFNTLFFSLLIVCTAQDTNGSTSLKPTLVRLRDYLLDEYKKAVRPVHDWRNATVVYLDVVIYAILGVNEKDQVLRSYLWLKQYWVDEFLTWDPKDFDNVTQISLPAQLIWAPDIIVLEFVEAKRSPEAPYVYVHNTGSILNIKPLLITTVCSLNIYYFPFDIQRCSVSFTSLILTAQDINVRLMKHHQIKDYQSRYIHGGEWDLVNLISKSKVRQNHEMNFGEVEFIIVIRRKSLFYSMTLILPSMFLMILDVAGFYLTPESGERISFKTTLLLSYSVFLIVISDTLPGVGTPLLGVYYVMCMGLLVLSLIESIFIVRMVHLHNINLQVPGWVRTLVLEKMSASLCMKDMVLNSQLLKDGSTVDLPNCNSNASEGNKETSVEASPRKENVTLLSGILKEIAFIRQHVKKTYNEKVTNEWLLVGYILDMFFFRTYVCIVIVFSVTLVIIWSIV